jgi:UPF0176 protein
MLHSTPLQRIVVAALYKFVTLTDYKELREPLKGVMVQHHINGALHLAEEGINGTVCGTREGIDALLLWLKQDVRFTDIDHKESYCDERPFQKIRVKLKREIITIGIEGVNPNKVVGKYVEPQQWNELISDPDVLIIDTRNDYEVDFGTFENAIDPKTKCFGEFPQFVKSNIDPSKHKKVAMFCTGGIRCEKASSYMLDQGFEEVYHLKGGILKYLEVTSNLNMESKWKGDCFVFDGRRAVRPDLTPIHVENIAMENCELGEE